MELNKDVVVPSDVKEIYLEHIDEPPQAMRTDINRDEIFELAADIKKNGLINPITVRPRGARFEVVAGHRRLLAHRYGGLPRVRCIVRDLTDDEAFAIMTSENLARQDVNPVDEAVHVSRLLSLYRGDEGKVADIVGRGVAWVRDRVSIGGMPDNLKQHLREGKMKLGVALALNEITDAPIRDVCIQSALSQGASVVVAQYYLAQWRAGLLGSSSAPQSPDSNAPLRERTVVMLRCALDGKEYPATDFRSVLVYRDNVQYLDAVRELLNSRASADADLSGGAVSPAAAAAGEGAGAAAAALP